MVTRSPEMQRTASDLALLLGRIALSALFIPGGLRKLTDLGAFTASLQKRDVPFAEVLAPLGAGVEFLGGIAVLIGFQTRLAALLVILFTIIATVIAHRFWEFEGPARQMQQGQFFKNLAIVGGFLALWVSGAGRFALDWLWRRDRYAGEERRMRERRTKAWSVPSATS
jgi:putative oxidoreductase